MMKSNRLIASLIFIVTFILPMQSSIAAEEVFGWEMMSEKERNEHRNIMRSFTTNEEREQYRIEHHKRMLERAKEKRLNMPAMPAETMGDGMGRGHGGSGGR